MFRNRTFSLALVGLFAWVTGCSSYTHIGLGEVTDHGKVRVTTTDGERDILYDPELVTDSVKGHEKAESERDYYDRIVVIPIDQVSTVEAVGTDEVGTILTVLGVFVGTVVLLAGLALESGY